MVNVFRYMFQNGLHAFFSLESKSKLLLLGLVTKNLAQEGIAQQKQHVQGTYVVGFNPAEKVKRIFLHDNEDNIMQQK